MNADCLFTFPIRANSRNWRIEIPSQMSRRRKILIVLVVVLGAAILIPVIHHYRLRAATEAYIVELKAKGEPMELAQVIPPPVPPEQNSADTFHRAAALVDADRSALETSYVYGMKMVAPGRAMIRWQQPDIRDTDGTNSWENVTAAVVQNAKTFALLQQIIEKPAFDFSIEYDRGVADLNFTNFDLAESKRSALRLEAAALCALHQGDTASAGKNLRAMLALVKAMRDERLVISELVRIAIAQIAVTVTWEILQSPNLTDEQLAELQRDWMILDFIQSDENALAMERVTGQITAATWRSSNSRLEDYFDTWFQLSEPGKKENFFERAKFGTQVFRWRYWWSYPDELRTLKGYQIMLESLRNAETNHSWQTILREQQNKLERLGINTNSAGSLWFSDRNKIDLHSIMSASVFSLGAVFNKVMRVEAARQATVTAIALKRYQLKHGSYPADLNSLVPEFLPAVPFDPVDGQPLRYRRNADGTFLLYSVGDNGKDDDGDPSLEKGVQSSSFYWENPHARDWVWPQPATAEEVQSFYEHPPK